MQPELQVPPPQLPLSVRPSKVFDTYWRFAAERQEIFIRRIAGSPPPWTADPILREFKFTNAYRASDRLSQYLAQPIETQQWSWLRGVDLNHRPLGYEAN
jgi:hypothetical protein